MDLDLLLKKLTVEEKCRILVGKDFWHTADIEGQSLPTFKMSDGPHGLRCECKTKKIALNQSEPSTCLPTASALANSWSVDRLYDAGTVLGEEALNQGVDVLLGPGINIKRNPRHGRNFEYFSEDPYLAGKLGASYIQGVQKKGAGACVKHFALNNRETRRSLTDSVADERTLREIYLTPFEIAVEEGSPKCIMTAYNRVNGQYADQNVHLLKDILRGEWGFDGVVMSDWGGTNNRVESLKASSDLSMPYSKYGISDLVAAVKAGQVSEELIDQSVTRILKLADEFEKNRNPSPFADYEQNHKTAVRCAEESIVLLKNNGVLPLNAHVPVGFVGDFVFNTRMQGCGSSLVNPYKTENIIDLLPCDGLTVEGTLKGFCRFGKKLKSFEEDLAALKEKVDTCVIFLGLNEYGESEGRDRDDISLPENQISVYRSVRAAFKKVVAVVINGSCLDLSPILDSDGIIFGGLLGQGGSRAILNVLSGKVSPSGKLSESFPISYDQVPTKSYFDEDFTIPYKEGIYVGYRYFEKAKKEVLFPFGYGLSYTEFEYSAARVDKNGVTFNLKNIGDRVGAEVCQLYVALPESRVHRPVKELKGFKKVILRPGETRKVTIPFDKYTFRYFNSEKNDFAVESGLYKIFVASSSEDIRLAVSTHVNGDGATAYPDVKMLPSYESGRVEEVSDGEFSVLLKRDYVKEDFVFIKKKRIVIGENSCFFDLKYSRSLLGRIIGRVFAKKYKKALKKKDFKKLNDLAMVANTPMRAIGIFGKLTRRQTEGLITLFNGKFFKGVGMLLSKK